MVKKLLQSLVCIAAATGLHPGLHAQQPLQATVQRIIAANVLDEQEFTKEQVTIRKGVILDVVRVDQDDILAHYDGQLVRVRKKEVTLAPKPDGLADVQQGAPALPGQLVLLAARYGGPAGGHRNVLNKLKPFVPKGVITSPVEAPVTDALIGREIKPASVQARMTQTTATNAMGEVVSTMVAEAHPPQPKVLTVEYQFNGRIYRKAALEGTTLSLP